MSIASSNSVTYKKPVLIVAVTIDLTLLICALVSIKRTPADLIRGKKMYWALISFVNFFGPLSYFLFGKRRP